MNHILDANCWAAYAQEMLENRAGCGVLSFRNAAQAGKIAFDDGELIIQQYKDCRPGQDGVLSVFLEEMATSGAIRLVVPVTDKAFHKELNSLGLPKGEHIYFRVAAAESPSTLISDDIDFFDPSKKSSSAKVRRKCKLNSSGPVCKRMKKICGVDIVCLESFGI